MTLDELFALDEGFPMEAGALLTEGPLPTEEEARVLARIRQTAGTASGKKGETKTVKKSRFGLMLLAAALVLGTVASAAAYFQPDGVIARTLGVAAEGWQEFFSGNGTAVGASQECDGWILTVDQVVGDGKCAYVLLDITAPEGVVLDADGYFLDFDLDFFGRTGGSMTNGQVEDGDKTDNHISILMEVTVDSLLLRPRTGHLEVTGLEEVIKRPYPEENEIKPYPADLEWQLDIPLRFKNRRIVYRPRKTLEVEGGTVKVTKVEITTLSATVKLISKDGGLGRWEVGDIIKPLPLVTEMRLLDEEGNPIPVDSWGSSGSGREGIQTVTRHTMVFQPVIDPDRAAALSIGGVVIPLK